MYTDWLEIEDLKIHTRIGVYDWEQRISQTLLLNMSCPITCDEATLALNDTVNYETLCQTVTDFVQAHAFSLIEHVAQQVATLILTTFQVPEVTVSVSKPFAVTQAKRMTVRVHRTRDCLASRGSS